MIQCAVQKRPPITGRMFADDAGPQGADRIMARALNLSERLHAPHLLDIEVTDVLRRLVLQKQITAARGELALDDLAKLVIERHGHESLLGRIWQLRDSLTSYDAAYVALAEALHAPLSSCDGK